MAKVLLKRVKATIIYASETGKSETFAQKLSKLMQMSFLINVQSMEDYDFDGITKESFLVIVTSTFGNGEAPDNGKVALQSIIANIDCIEIVTNFNIFKIGILEKTLQIESLRK